MDQQKSPWVLRLLKGFAMFWWDFLVGDTPELFVGTMVVLGVLALLSVVAHQNVLSVVALPLLVIAMLAASVVRAARAAGR